jgi:hypothetical protein
MPWKLPECIANIMEIFTCIGHAYLGILCGSVYVCHQVKEMQLDVIFATNCIRFVLPAPRLVSRTSALAICFAWLDPCF